MEIQKEINELAANFEACHKTLSAIGDETRQHIILEMMRMDYNGSRVIEISEKTNLSRPAVSHHLQILKEAGIVKMRRDDAVDNFKYVVEKMFEIKKVRSQFVEEHRRHIPEKEFYAVNCARKNHL